MRENLILFILTDNNSITTIYFRETIKLLNLIAIKSNLLLKYYQNYYILISIGIGIDNLKPIPDEIIKKRVFKIRKIRKIRSISMLTYFKLYFKS